ncbi:hypothetical protein HanIR_Chr11g0527811 [Helianthus annuus]|nr:hypothetical protein HanIR_Chr11g0527811 [Helianthus annuus]
MSRILQIYRKIHLLHRHSRRISPATCLDLNSTASASRRFWLPLKRRYDKTAVSSGNRHRT